MTRGSQISRWLAQVKADHRLVRSELKLAIQLTQWTNADEFARSGDLVTWQGVAKQAKETRQDARTVQRATRRLQAFGHIKVDPGGGRHRSNRITLILKAVAPFEVKKTPAAVPPFSHKNPGTGVRVSDRKTPAAPSRNPGISVQKPRRPRHPNLLITNDRTSATSADTEASGPRRAEGALGPLGAKLRKRIGDEDFEAWLGKGEAEFVEQTADTVTIAVSSSFFAAQIRNRFEPDIAACSGARRVEFVVREATR